MLVSHSIRFESFVTLPINIDEPEQCPLCKAKIKPVLLNSKSFPNNRDEWFISFNFLCHHCFKPFLGFFSVAFDSKNRKAGDANLLFLEPNLYLLKVFSEYINSISKSFIEIYNQALAAESYKLNEISGIGYRKALEFLIKDFLVKENPDEAEKISNMLLKQCIDQYVTDPNLKTTSLRAVWLGNDQTHYIQKFKDKDIVDLKRLIELTIRWIEIILMTREAEEIQPK